MSHKRTAFTNSFLQAKKKEKAKLLFFFLRQIIVNNYRSFFVASLLAVITAIVNYNIGNIFRANFFSEPKNDLIIIAEEIEKSDNEQEVEKILKESKKKFDFFLKSEKEKYYNKEKIQQLAKKIKSAVSSKNIFEKNDFVIKFNFFYGWDKEWKKLGWKKFCLWLLAIISLVKSSLSLLHYYLMNYSYVSIEKDLKNDLFRHFIQSKYSRSIEIAPNLIAQFASDLDVIANQIWLIPNRLIYAATSIFYYIGFGFNSGQEGINWKFFRIAAALFSFLIVAEIWLFHKAAKLNLAAKRRYEEENKVIYERINSLEYIKAVSGENYEKKKIAQQLDDTFQKNKNSLLWSVLFKAFPNYVIIPNISIAFVFLTLWFTPKAEENYPVFVFMNFVHYYFTVQRLNTEINKIIDALLNLEDLTNNLLIVKENVKVLSPPSELIVSPRKFYWWENGDIFFEKVVFAYPHKPQQIILQNFSFCFKQGKIYGIAGKNGIGKSTITKSFLKLYDLQDGRILVGERDIQEIDSVSLHKKVCYQTNRPGFFRLTIAENVFYPETYQKNDWPKLVAAAKQAGCWEFISKLPAQFETELREGGTDLSEGQKQQIAAMRIFIRDYDVYILDEILSNVHPKLRETILYHIFSWIKGKTTIVIDHHYKIFHYVDYVYQFTGEKLLEMKKEDFLN